MKKLLIAALLIGSFGLVGCSEQIAKFRSTVTAAVQIYERVTTTTVTPTQIVVVANAFNGVKSLAGGYLRYCKDSLTRPICSADNRRVVIKYMRDGTTARNKLEPYILTGGAAPGDVYNALVDSINGLNAQPIAQAGG